MSAYNWVLIEGICPICSQRVQIRCQTHVASDFDGDRTGRFHDREYRIGETMAWWARGDRRFDNWPAESQNGGVESVFNEEACYSTCENCNAELFVIIRFRENVPEQVVAIGREEDWPPGFLK